jgi:MoxR-like ATPase
MSINTKTLQTIMCAPGIGNRRGLRALLWGKPGVGKTTQVEAVARAMGAHLITIIASIREPSDFLGLPMPDGKGGATYAPPSWAREANEAASKGKLVVVFFDEITTCAPAVQASLLRVVNEGYVGDLKLHANVIFLAAANPPEYAAGGYDLAPPMANRWMHIDWHDPSATDWAAGMLSGWQDTIDVPSAESVMKRIDDNYARADARARGLVTGFLRANSQHLMKMPDQGDPNASRAWPSPRTWELAVRALAASEAMNLPQSESDTMLGGCVGVGVAGELIQYQLAADLPDPEKLLDADDPKTVWFHNPERPDVTAAVLNSCAALVTPQNASKREARALNLWKLIANTAPEAGDIAVAAAVSLTRARLSNVPGASKLMLKLGKTMAAMGMIPT